MEAYCKGRFGTAQPAVNEYKKVEWRKERNNCGKMTDGKEELGNKIVLKC